MAFLTQILRSIIGRQLGLDANNNLVLGGHKIYYNHSTGAEGVFDLTSGGGGGGGGGFGPGVAFAPLAGVVDPNIAGFTAGLGAAGTGRLYVSLVGDTSFPGLPQGADGQQLAIIRVGGNFKLSLLPLSGLTAQQQILASNPYDLALYDALALIYDDALGQWVLLP